MSVNSSNSEVSARLIPLGDRAVLVRFGTKLALETNQLAQQFASICADRLGPIILGCTPNLVSVTVQYDPIATSFAQLREELMLLIGTFEPGTATNEVQAHEIEMAYGGEYGPDLDNVCSTLGKTKADFVAEHSAQSLHALALGFSPGFLYLGLHNKKMRVPRQSKVRENVAAGSILFAAGQSAITSREIRTGWHVIGRTQFRNFDVSSQDPISIYPGQLVSFKPVKTL